MGANRTDQTLGFIPVVVPHRAVAEVSNIGNVWERLVVVNRGWQSESADGPEGGWSCVFWNGCGGHLTTTAGCVYLYICLSACLSICLSASLKTKLFCVAASVFELDNIKNEAILRDFLNFWSWHQKTKQFCETSFNNAKLGAEITASYQCVLRLPQMRPGHTKCCTCHTKSSYQNWRSDAPKCSPSQESSAPDLLTSLMNMSFVLRLPREMNLPRSSSNAPPLPLFLDMLRDPHVLLAFDKVHNPLRLPGETTSELQKCSVPVSFLRFWFRHVLRATTACTFSTSQLPKVVRTWCVLYILTWTCASRHNGVHFFISHRASWLRTRRFSEPTFRPFGASNHWRNTMLRDFSTFSRTCIFFPLTLSLLWFSFFFSSLLFSDSFHLCFSICPYCRKFDF